jgi:hypothetical protein
MENRNCKENKSMFTFWKRKGVSEFFSNVTPVMELRYFDMRKNPDGSQHEGYP